VRAVNSLHGPRPAGSLVIPFAGVLTGALVAWMIWAPRADPLPPAATATAPVAPSAAAAPAIQTLAMPVVLEERHAQPLPEPSAKPRLPLRVLSIVQGGDGRRVTFLGADGSQLMNAGEGEEVAGYRVMQIEDGAAVIAHGQELERVEMDGGAPARPSP